ncbi:MAG TPA: hypothetical protein VFT43_12655, partial [Candidatus Polarisedimenticolia bacterium]|nr:hypothetical protein [Candidatus Polarisedimenticolia bacterium]
CRVDFRVGGPPPVGAPPEGARQPAGVIEAKILAVRGPRHRDAPPRDRGNQRQEPQDQDPQGGRVLVLLVTDASQVPEGVESGHYRIFLRFARR